MAGRYGLALGVGLLLVGCDLPWDPNGTLSRVRDGGMMRVGIIHAPPWAVVTPDGKPAGVEERLVRELADQLGAKLAWKAGGSSQLMKELQNFQLDVVIGGLHADTPWQGRVALTRAYYRDAGHDHVLALPPGENGWLVHVNRVLREKAPETVEAALKEVRP